MPKNFDNHYFDHHILLYQLSLLLLTTSNLISTSSATPRPIGICYGRVANNLPPPAVAVNILKSNNITNVRLFNADPATLASFVNSAITLMKRFPNELLSTITTTSVAAQWLQPNIFTLIPANQVRYIAVGNEVFLKDPYYSRYVVPAILSLHEALQSLNLADQIKLSSPQAASVLSNSYPPSSGEFDPKVKPYLLPLIRFLHDTSSPFMVNLYPYFSYLNNRRYVSVDYALFRGRNRVYDGAWVYENLFDASVDAFVGALEREGFGEVEVVVSEMGWPTRRGEEASVENAREYNGEVVRRAAGVEVYLFDMFDE